MDSDSTSFGPDRRKRSDWLVETRVTFGVRRERRKNNPRLVTGRVSPGSRGEPDLAVSSTNVAVDTALLSADQRVKCVFATDARPSLLRFGSRFGPAKYEHCQHLVPVRDKSLIGMYEQHLRSVPSPGDPERYRIWRQKLESIRARLPKERRSLLKTARLAAMTATYAVSLFDELARPGKDFAGYCCPEWVAIVAAIVDARATERAELRD